MHSTIRAKLLRFDPRALDRLEQRAATTTDKIKADVDKGVTQIAKRLDELEAMFARNIESHCACPFACLAAKELGFHHLGIVEKDPRCIATLTANGFRNVIGSPLHSVDFSHFRPTLLTGGLPCQPWSSGGLRKGESDERNLWYEAIRAIRESLPMIVFLEMVIGFLEPSFERVREEVLSSLEELGYYPYIHSVNAYDYGLPAGQTSMFPHCP